MRTDLEVRSARADDGADHAVTASHFRPWGWGPGLVFLLTAIGPQDLLSNAAAGAEFGYALLWTMVPVLAIRYSILEASARYALASGESLMAGYARVGRWMAWLLLFAILVKRFLSGLYQVLIMGQVLDLMLPATMRGHEAAGAMASWALGMGIVWRGRYRAVERASVPLLMLLGGSLVLAAFGSRPDWSQALRGLLVPAIPNGHGFYSGTLILMALLGSGAASISNLKYAAFAREKGWRDVSFLRRQRIDLLVTGLLFLVMLVLLQVTAAATLGVHGARLKEVADLLPLFTTALGGAGRVVFAIGVWTAVFTTFIGANSGYGLLVADIWHGVLRPAPPERQYEASGTPAYRWAILSFAVPPLLALFVPLNPIGLALATAVVLAVLLPVVIFVLLWLCNDRGLMGDHANGWVSNLTLTLALIVTLYLTWRGATEFFFA